ncbi:nickel-responsive transcriptional regulator NikR [Salinadaptatus halalkaliphilus]|uniref:Nickel-responsive transcriptional regulator NikR n=1 Tax=Salinadaptatus halalkaliphilus TaxID=2419781 RepID=A0A4V6RUF0_9EURY|nr:CopG family ribbon-helix-helix protein [Salinadaptatus halalkaliphilus]THE66657.1 nickel-responsive transcriptional regulator NikR [Salinadaptatus halalkaliphilus]
MPVVSVSMPAELIDQLDAVVTDHDYTGRSEVVREGARTLLSEFDDDRLEGRPLTGIVGIFYAYGNQRIERELTALRHDHGDIVASTDHSHVGDDDCCPSVAPSADGSDQSAHAYCLDVFVLEGLLEEVSTFVGGCRAIDGVETVEYSLVPLDGVGQLRTE